MSPLSLLNFAPAWAQRREGILLPPPCFPGSCLPGFLSPSPFSRPARAALSFLLAFVSFPLLAARHLPLRGDPGAFGPLLRLFLPPFPFPSVRP
eukprot:4161528-Heterocapsa_arctica.AAC.1